MFSLLYDDDMKRHITLIEISKSELKRFQKNHLSGIIDHPLATPDKKTSPLYSKLNDRSNINRRKRNVSFVDTLFVNYIDL